MNQIILSFCLLVLVTSTPIALFHGFGDECANSGMKKFSTEIGQLVGDYSGCVEIGDGASDSISMDFAVQAQTACSNIKSNPNFQGKTINVIGLSQGALIARYIASDCDFGGKVEKVLSIGGPQMGVSAFPHCGSGIICWPINHLAKSLVYTEYAQGHIGPAGYFRDQSNIQSYLEKSHFLPDLNNERNSSDNRKARITGLKGFMLVKFTKDTMIHPKETAWFQQWNENGDVIDLEETDFYKQDLIGLKSLKEQGKVTFVEIEGDHLRFSESDINNTFVPFLKD